jgi:hypothetical protein
MPRVSIPQSVQAEVLVESRRRCCICFGLNRDTALKVGQIAHLDKDSANPRKENLAFLCFEHHDLYDSSTRQSKNLTMEEVKHYRTELQKALNMAFGQAVTFGEVRTFSDPVAGHYLLESPNESADLKVTRLPDGTFHVHGFAFWGTKRKYGPNIGEIDFIGSLVGDSLVFSDEQHDGRTYRAIFTFHGDGLTVTEESPPGPFGLNVGFGGSYARAA